MNTIIISQFSNEAASKTKGLILREHIEKFLSADEKCITVDFKGITRFASPFFNNSFSALALIYGFSVIRSIQLINIDEVGRMTYETSLSNAEMVSDHPEQINQINQIIENTPKKVML